MKKLIKSVSFALALCIFTGALAGCNKDDNSDGKMKISYAAWTLGPVDENSVVEKALEERFPDVDFELIPFERSTWVEQISTRIAGGDSPDIIYRDHSYYVKESVKQNIVAEIPFDMVKEYAKETYEATLDYGTDVWYATYYQGKNWGLPLMQPNQSHGQAAIWRMDWLKKVGIDKVPETIEEFETAITKFVNEDPDGNGANDTLGITWNMKSNPHLMFNGIIAAFAGSKNSSGDSWVENGEVKYVINEPGFKQGIELLSKWYADGLIDREFITTDASTINTKWANGQLGFVADGALKGVPGGSLYEAVKDIDPNAEIAIGPLPTGPDGNNIYYENPSVAVTSSITFGKHLEKDPEKLKKAVEIANAMISEQELYGILHYGVEGEHWDRDPETNEAKMKDEYVLAQDQGPVGTNIFYGLPATPAIQSYYGRNDMDEIFSYEKNGKQKVLTESWMGASIEQDVLTSGNSVSDELRAIILNVVVGGQTWADVEAYIPTFIEGQKKLAEAKLASYESDVAQNNELLSQLGVEK